jgi:hypothetical protein
MGRRRHSFQADLSRQILAMGCAVLIFALGLFAASPVLHSQLHAGGHATFDDGCAVTLFANGVSVALPLQALPPPSDQWGELPDAVSLDVILDSPRYLLQPERGPPVV